ncbi:MAG: outer membrane protein assembly factor BamD [Fibrobacter sp.]|jgi:outer membrane assembly lipoprotein YfiO|nr:outer membrane protein assembly factor BamD [Fibrobacter sp.]
MSKIVISFFFITALLVIPGFSKGRKSKLFDCSDAISKAVSFYNEGKYSRVKTILGNAKIQCGGSPLMDSILYYLGMADLKSKNYIEGRTSFELLAQDYHRSPFHKEAQFRIGHAVYLQSQPSGRDQQETKEAISLLRDFLDDNPDGPFADSARKYLDLCFEKLARKDFDAANFYIKINELESAVVCFKTFLQDHPQSKYADQARYTAAELLIKLERKSESKEMLDALIQNSSDKVMISKAHGLLKQVQ